MMQHAVILYSAGAIPTLGWLVLGASPALVWLACGVGGSLARVCRWLSGYENSWKEGDTGGIEPCLTISTAFLTTSAALGGLFYQSNVPWGPLTGYLAASVFELSGFVLINRMHRVKEGVVHHYFDPATLSASRRMLVACSLAALAIASMAVFSVGLFAQELRPSTVLPLNYFRPVEPNSNDLERAPAVQALFLISEPELSDYKDGEVVSVEVAFHGGLNELCRLHLRSEGFVVPTTFEQLVRWLEEDFSTGREKPLREWQDRKTPFWNDNLNQLRLGAFPDTEPLDFIRSSDSLTMLNLPERAKLLVRFKKPPHGYDVALQLRLLSIGQASEKELFGRAADAGVTLRILPPRR